MRGFSVGGRTTVTTAVAFRTGVQLWNPSTSRSLYVTQISWAKTVATVDNIALGRTSARGTITTSVVPVQQNDADNVAAPRSTAALDIVFSVIPTYAPATPIAMFQWNLPAAIGSGFILPIPDAIEVPAGTGLALYTPVAVILQPADSTFWWRE